MRGPWPTGGCRAKSKQTLTQAISTWPYQQMPVTARPVCMVLVVAGMALGQGFLPVLRLSPVGILPPVLHTHSFIDPWRYIISALRTSLSNTLKV